MSAAEISALRERLERTVRGKPEVVELALVCLFADGHLLVEDVPGVGKTTLATALARAVGGTFRRVQFTSDLLPADILGCNVLEAGGQIRFREGPIFANVVLADEINRTTPRTQSALLEAMNEAQVSVDGHPIALPDPFLVIATQNPHEFHGTFPLPDSQLDRFLVRTSMGYLDRESERAVLRGAAREHREDDPTLDLATLRSLRVEVARVAVHPEVEDFLLDVVGATRTHPALARGVSTRGAEALHRAVRALAYVRGRAYAIPEDVRALAVPVLAHRVVPRAEDGAGAGAAAIQAVLAGVAPPA